MQRHSLTILLGSLFLAGQSAIAEPPKTTEDLGCPAGPQGLPPPPSFGHFGGPGGSGGPGGPDGLPPHMIPFAAADLTDDQVEKISAIKDGQMEKLGPVISSLHSLEHKRTVALLADSIDTSAVEKLGREILERKQLLDRAFQDELLSSAQVLTAEQRRKLRLHMERAEVGPTPHPHGLPGGPHS